MLRFIKFNSFRDLRHLVRSASGWTAFGSRICDSLNHKILSTFKAMECTDGGAGRVASASSVGEKKVASRKGSGTVINFMSHEDAFES